MSENLDNMETKEQERLEQLVTEALMRDKIETPNLDGEWNKLAAKMAISSPKEENASQGRIFFMRKLWMTIGAAAAVVLVAVLLFAGLGNTDKDALYAAKSQVEDVVIVDEENHEQVVANHDVTLAPSSHIEQHTVVVPEGKDMKLTLADGTQVWLNANSRLTYPTAFTGSMRQVELQGEAYFKVTHDASHPFIVKAGGMQTRVLGTEFCVDASAAAKPHVTLVEGKVKVSSPTNNKVLVPGEDAAMNEQGEIKISHVDTNDVACWREGIQLFDNVSLRDIVMQMGSWYNVNVVCHDEALLNTHLRYMYDRRKSLEEAVKMLNDISNDKIILHNNTILIE